LFFDPKTLELVNARLKERNPEGSLSGLLEDPQALNVLQANLRADRADMRDTLRGRSEERKAMRANAEKVAAAVADLIPASITGPKRDILFRDCLRDVKERIERLQIKQLDPADVPLIVSARFREQGIGMGGGGNGGSGNGAAPKGSGAGPGRTGQEFRQSSARRRAAAVTVPAGAGAPVTKPRPELPKTTKERISLARKVGLRRLLGRE